MFAQVPAIAEVVVALDGLYPFAFSQAQIIGAAPFEVIYICVKITCRETAAVECARPCAK